MIRLLKDAFKVKDIRSRILFTVLILFVFRLGTHITVPGVSAKYHRRSTIFKHVKLGKWWRHATIFDFLDGVSLTSLPQLLFSCCRWISSLNLLNGRNKVGRKKLNQATRYLTLVLGFVQSMTLTAGFNYYSTRVCKQS